MSEFNFYSGIKTPPVTLVECGRGDPHYKGFRDRHYIPNKGSFGKQVHYLVIVEGKVAGVISGGESVFSCKPFQDFFKLPPCAKMKVGETNPYSISLNGIIQNTVFRMEDSRPNLASKVLAMWRKRVAHDWESSYSVKPFGFLTFIIESDARKGSLYKADNWSYLGDTIGNTKTHSGKGSGLGTPHARATAEKKMIFAKKIRGGVIPTEYRATWNATDPETIAFTKARSKNRNLRIKQGKKQLKELLGESE